MNAMTLPFPMRNVAQSVAFTFRHRRSAIESAIKRWRLALAFARRTLTEDQAQDIVCACEPVAGWYPLTTLCADNVLAFARETYEDHSALLKYIRQGCARVHSKYDSDGDELHSAKEWAVEEAVAYAKDDGIVFEKRPEDSNGEMPNIRRC